MTLKKLILTTLKVGVSAAIIAWLVWDATKAKNGTNVFAQLVEQPKNWGALVMAGVCCTAAVLITFARWWCLVRALEVPCRFADAIRISFWGYLFNLAPLGIVGGDLVKAMMLAHEQHGYRARSVASVMVDRIIGLYLLFVVASTAILLTGFWRIDAPDLRAVCNATFWLTGLGAVGIVVMLTPGVTDGRATRALGRIPRVGQILESLIDAVRMYRRKPVVLLVAAAMSICVHCLFAVGCYLIARGLPGQVLALGSYFVIMPLSSAANVLPLPAGPFEATLNFLYTHVPEGVAITKGQGLVVALAYRLIMVLIAGLGIGYYFSNRREMAEVIHEAEQEQETPGEMVGCGMLNAEC